MRRKSSIIFLLNRFEKVYLNSFHLIHVNLMKIVQSGLRIFQVC